MEYYIYNGGIYPASVLMHHGIKGQKWGVMNGPPYPLGASDHSKSEKDAGWRKSLNKNSSSYKSNGRGSGPSVTDQELNDAKKATKLLAMSPEDSEKLAKIAKIAGISLATTAGVMAVGYIAYKYGPDMKAMISDPKAYAGVLTPGYNADRHIARTIGLTDELFNNSYNDDAIGAIARSRGLGFVSAEQIANSIKNPVTRSMSEGDLSDLVKNITTNLRTSGSTRRLSCWPGSNAYFMSMMTGQDYASRSFTNLVDFHDFGKLFTKTPKIFNANGQILSDFVGRWGKGYARADANTTKSLIKSIFKNISAADNLTPDGSRTIGFINAAYGGTTCTHEWNFDIVHKANGLKELIMSDTWDGSRYSVANLAPSGKINYTDAFSHLVDEMHHYNARSIRFYAPKVETVNPSMMANVILGKTERAVTNATSSVTSNAAKAARNIVSQFGNSSAVSSFTGLSAQELQKYVQGILEKLNGL